MILRWADITTLKLLSIVTTKSSYEILVIFGTHKSKQKIDVSSALKSYNISLLKRSALSVSNTSTKTCICD